MKHAQQIKNKAIEKQQRKKNKQKQRQTLKEGSKKEKGGHKHESTRSGRKYHIKHRHHHASERGQSSEDSKHIKGQYQKHSSPRKHENDQPSFHKHLNCTLWIFSIPIECKDKQMKHALADCGIAVRNMDWKMKQDMQYMQVQLIEGITTQRLYELQLKVDKYPVVVIPKRVYDNYIHFELHKLQVEMNFQKDPNEIELIRYVNTIGNVVLFIKDEYYGPKKYIVVFNCQAKAKLLLHSQENVCKDCLMTRPRCPLRLGRIQKMFTFTKLNEQIEMSLFDSVPT